MDHNQQQQVPSRSSDGFSNNSNGLFPDNNSQFAYGSMFSNGQDQTFSDASWGVNANAYSNPAAAVQSRAPSQVARPQGWQQNQTQLSSVQPNVNSQASPYSRPVSQSPASFAQNPYGQYNNQPAYPYQQPQQPQQQQQQFDPALFNNNNNKASSPGAGLSPSYAAPGNQQPSQSVAIAQSPLNTAGTPVEQPNRQQSMSQPAPFKTVARQPIDQHALVASIPKGNDANGLSIIDFEQLVVATNSEKMGHFINIGREPLEWPVNRSTALPAFNARRSKNDLRKLVGNDPILLAKIGKKTKKQNASAGARAIAKNMSKSGRAESSSEEDSSDDESTYTSDSDTEGSPLPSKRPTAPKDAVEYDTIKALWRNKRKSLDSADIRKGLTDFWEIVKTIRDQWKADTSAVQDAEEKKRAGDLPLLESRVKDQRGMMETAFKTALKHGNRSIIELLSENVPLIFICYQFLLDRFKDEDVNGPLARAILETMTIFTTLTDEKLEKTHLVKVLPRYIKKGDAKTQFYAKRVSSNAGAGTKEKSGDAPKPAGLLSPSSKRAEPEPVAGVKRPANTTAEGGAAKRPATAAKPNGTTVTAKPNAVNKAAPTVSAVGKPAPTPSSTAAAIKAKAAAAKPSGFLSSLQSATKKPGTSIKGNVGAATGAKPGDKKPVAGSAAPRSTFSFAETMANLAKPKVEEKPVLKEETNLPPETDDEKSKRLRKEERRKLRVSWRDDDLVEVRYFTHDPEEELGHDSSQMRDMSDVGGEGRMLKMHMMDIDDEEETAEGDEKFVEFREPSSIDFSDIPHDERTKMYAPYGGGEMEPESSERAVREKYEANTLLVFYTDPNDVPPNPREPADPYNGLQSNNATEFGKPDDQKLAARLAQRKGPGSNVPAPNAPAQDFGQQQAPAISSDLQKLLATLAANAKPQPQPAQQQQAPPSLFNFPMPQPAAPAPATQPPNIDLTSILASLGAGPAAAPAKSPQLGGGFGASGFAPPPQQQSFNRNTDDAPRKWTKDDPKPYGYKTQTCRFWRQGTCQKGDNCTYAHEELDN